MTNVRRSKPRSPPAPTLSLEEAVEAVDRLYSAFSHGTFIKNEIASVLKMSAGSGPFARKLFSLKEYGLIQAEGDGYHVSNLYKRLSASKRGRADFKEAASEAIRRSIIFKWILSEASNRLPGTDVLVTRLEHQKKFNADRAKEVADVLRKSLIYAGILDKNNNILPIRDDDEAPKPDQEEELPSDDGDEYPARYRGNLRMDVSLSDGRVAVVFYPPDMKGSEASKIGKVLHAMAGEPD